MQMIKNWRAEQLEIGETSSDEDGNQVTVQ